MTRGDKYCLEGFLFPDTYDFYKNSSPREVLEKMLDNFDYRFSEEMRAQIDTLNATVTDGKGGVFWHTQGSGPHREGNRLRVGKPPDRRCYL